MNLIVDVGNTSVKLAVFELETIQGKWECNKTDFKDTLLGVRSEYSDISRAIVSNVGDFGKANADSLQQYYPTLFLSYQSELPFQNHYTTPETLGVDRMALVSAASKSFKKENVLIIDAGTCITYDFLNDENKYLGGAISPGVEMRYKSLHTFTAKLPLLKKKMPHSFFGDSTEDAIHVGVVISVLNEIEGFISNYQKEYPNLRVILTGGDAHFLRDRIKNDIFANSNFLLEGLNYILETNKHSC